jgi:hypothetical protein
MATVQLASLGLTETQDERGVPSIDEMSFPPEDAVSVPSLLELEHLAAALASALGSEVEDLAHLGLDIVVSIHRANLSLRDDFFWDF